MYLRELTNSQWVLHCTRLYCNYVTWPTHIGTNLHFNGSVALIVSIDTTHRVAVEHNGMCGRENPDCVTVDHKLCRRGSLSATGDTIWQRRRNSLSATGDTMWQRRHNSLSAAGDTMHPLCPDAQRNKGARERTDGASARSGSWN